MATVEAPLSRRSDRNSPAVFDDVLLRAIPHIVADLEHRFPTAAPSLVRRCVDDAADTMHGARVRKYLPILIERRAADALRAAFPGAR